MNIQDLIAELYAGEIAEGARIIKAARLAEIKDKEIAEGMIAKLQNDILAYSRIGLHNVEIIAKIKAKKLYLEDLKNWHGSLG